MFGYIVHIKMKFYSKALNAQRDRIARLAYFVVAVAFYRAMVVAAAAAVAVAAVVDFHRIGSIRHLSLNTNCLLSVLYCLLLFLYTLYTHCHMYTAVSHSLYTCVCVPNRISLFSLVVRFSSLSFYIEMIFSVTVLYCFAFYFYDIVRVRVCVHFMD